MNINKDKFKDLDKLKEKSQSDDIAVISDKVRDLMWTTLMLKKPKSILEIGTGTGYSATVMAKCLQSIGQDFKIVTIEKDKKSFDKANKSFSKTNLIEKITAYNMDAKEYIEQASVSDQSFDFIFLDGPKARYKDYLDLLVYLLNKGGVLFVDNVLFRGHVLKEDYKEIPKRYKTIIVKLRKFLENLIEEEKLNTHILKTGDGVSISIKK
ncbi:MAG: O-methyltransferase [Halanaerobiales bacterium]